jgi:hypothetical protein
MPGYPYAARAALFLIAVVVAACSVGKDDPFDPTQVELPEFNRGGEVPYSELDQTIGNRVIVRMTSASAVNISRTLGPKFNGADAERIIELHNMSGSPMTVTNFNLASGFAQICSCSGALNLGSFEPGDCWAIRVIPSMPGETVQSVDFSLEPFFSVRNSAVYPTGATVPDPGLVLGGTCN